MGYWPELLSHLELRWPAATSLPRGSRSYDAHSARRHKSRLTRIRVSPSRRRALRQLRSTPLPFYGLPAEWNGQRHIGPFGVGVPTGHGGSFFGQLGGRQNAHKVSLVHVSANGAMLRVSSYQASTSARFVDAAALRDLARRSGTPRPHLDNPEVPGLGWRRIQLPVAGERVTFRLAARGDEWAAVTTWHGFCIAVDGSGFPIRDVSLVRIPDPMKHLPADWPYSVI